MPKLSYSQFIAALRKQGVTGGQAERAWQKYLTTGSTPGTGGDATIGGPSAYPSVPIATPPTNNFSPNQSFGYGGGGGGSLSPGAYPSVAIPKSTSNNFVQDAPFGYGGSGGRTVEKGYSGGGATGPYNSDVGLFGPAAAAAGNTSTPVKQSLPYNIGNIDTRVPQYGGGKSQVVDRVQRKIQRQPNPMGDALTELLGAYAQYGQGGPEAPTGYGDFTQQATDLVGKIYSPQFAALLNQEKQTQSNYTAYDKIVEGLYANLQKDLQGQIAGTQADYAKAGASNTANTQALTGNIANTYAQQNAGLTKALTDLGIEAAAPDVLAPGSAESAYQQTSAQNIGAAQGNYLQNAGQNMNNMQQGEVTAAGAQGASSRQGLIRDLAAMLGQIGQQRADLGSRQASDVLSQSNMLSERDYGARRNAYTDWLENQKGRISMAEGKYGAITGADDRDWTRAYQTAQLEGQAGGDIEDPRTDMGKLKSQFEATYGPGTGDYLTIAAQAAQGGGSGALQNPTVFANHVSQQLQRYFGPNFDPQAAQEAIAFIFKGMSMPTSESAYG